MWFDLIYYFALSCTCGLPHHQREDNLTKSSIIIKFMEVKLRELKLTTLFYRKHNQVSKWKEKRKFRLKHYLENMNSIS